MPSGYGKVHQNLTFLQDSLARKAEDSIWRPFKTRRDYGWLSLLGYYRREPSWGKVSDQDGLASEYDLELGSEHLNYVLPIRLNC